MRTLLAGCGLALILSGCGGPSISDAAVRDFQSKARADVPYMERYGDVSDYRTLLEAICDSLDGGQSYKLVSRTVAAYINKEAYDGEVDSLIKIGHETGCPDVKMPDLA
ncbi:hypothetical protein [Nocardioides jejuensis]|uniref:DUF732 domain-containing protein n=1 Tax=Nocardioides jejuensis TaxID=2502782 RepID=A0A4R1BYC1_9ACTN|nr:hypothetical protein [Nocardioides jejuensis]TCJ23011.1 hypothetical protein EPD65_11660 [Nocardioides jejuensis]